MEIKPEHLNIILDRVVALGIPADGITAGGELTYSEEPTEEQRADAQAVIDAYDSTAEDTAVAAQEAVVAAAVASKNTILSALTGSQLATAKAALMADIAAVDAASDLEKTAILKRMMQRQLNFLTVLTALLPE